MRVVVSSEIPRSGIDLLEAAGHDVSMDIGLRGDLDDAEALLTLLSDRVDSDLFDRAPRLRIVSNLAVGYDNIDIDEASRRGIYVTNTPDVLTEATADMTWALILAVARRVPEGDALMRSGRFDGWHPMLLLGKGLSGRTLGIIGMGRIGSAVARRASGFGMRVVYHNRAPVEGSEHEHMTLDDLLRASDVVCLHVPGAPGTCHMIRARELAIMGEGTILVNMARGNVIDERALVKALRDRVIWGAGLDVYEFEPEMADGLASLDNVVLSPHLGSATERTRSMMAEMCATSIIDALAGRVPANLVGSGERNK